MFGEILIGGPWTQLGPENKIKTPRAQKLNWAKQIRNSKSTSKMISDDI